MSDGGGAGLRSKALAGLFWSAAARGAQQIVALGSTFVLARLLAPQDFGYVAMITTFSGFATLLTEFGLSAAVVHDRRADREQLSTLFWITAAFGAISAAAFFVAAPAIGAFYRAPAVVPLVRLLAVNFAVGGLGIVPRGLLTRDLRFDCTARADVLGVVAAAGVGIVLAVSGAGAWSLAWAQVASTALTTAAIVVQTRWLPVFAWVPGRVRPMLHFGGGVTGFSVVNYWSRNADNLLVAKLVGAAALGLYVRAYALMLFPVVYVSGLVSNVMFAAFASIQNDVPRIRSIYLRALRVITFLTFPMTIGMALVADPLIAVCFGAKWSGAVPALRILAPVGTLQSIFTPLGALYQARGKTTALFWFGVVASSFMVTAIAIGAFGFRSIEGVSAAYLIACCMTTIPGGFIVGGLLETSHLAMWRALGGNALLTGLMAGAVALTRLALRGAPAWEELAAAVAVGCVVYAGGAWALKLEALGEVIDIVRRRGAAKRAAIAAVARGDAGRADDADGARAVP